mmetsp:Transcript_7509/g.16095  ORF Transcript_7509/g.16095 Transcript_7509/m.16095 type:complete len:216 (-) Transcript_7509:1895-2542(-)
MGIKKTTTTMMIYSEMMMTRKMKPPRPRKRNKKRLFNPTWTQSQPCSKPNPNKSPASTLPTTKPKLLPPQHPEANAPTSLPPYPRNCAATNSGITGITTNMCRAFWNIVMSWILKDISILSRKETRLFGRKLPPSAVPLLRNRARIKTREVRDSIGTYIVLAFPRGCATFAIGSSCLLFGLGSNSRRHTIRMVLVTNVFCREMKTNLMQESQGNG